MGVDMGSRIAIVGPNGAGKVGSDLFVSHDLLCLLLFMTDPDIHLTQTTLMNLLSGDLVPSEGEQRRSFKLRVGRYAQHFVDALSMDENPVEYLMSKYPVRGL